MNTKTKKQKRISIEDDEEEDSNIVDIGINQQMII
jgi:hypothetical protein